MTTTTTAGMRIELFSRSLSRHRCRRAFFSATLDAKEMISLSLSMQKKRAKHYNSCLFLKLINNLFNDKKKQNAALAAAVAATPTSSSSPSSAGGFKVALLGAGGGIGQPLGLLLKL